jgi:hypothetical protein
VGFNLNRFGLALTVAFALGGLAFLLGPFFGLSLGDRTAGFFWLGIALVVLVKWRRGNIEAARQEQIVQSGSRGVATVVSAAVHGTGRGSPTLSLRLRLDLPGAAARQVDHTEEVTVYAAEGIKPGLKLSVVADPKDPNSIVLVW